MLTPKYQIFPPLRPEELRALEADIAKRGVQVPVEVDEEGNILDGHHRAQIARRLKLPYTSIKRKFRTEAEKREHVLKLNFARRHLDSMRWGLAFRMLCRERGVELRSGARNELTSATVAEVAQELGVPERTARHRVAQAKAYEALPKTEQEAVDRGEKTLRQACTEVQRTQRIREVAKLPADKFRVIYADPPWKYGDTRSGLDGTTGAEHHYPTMAIPELCAIPVEALTTNDAVLFLWVTAPIAEACYQVIEAWGFRYKAEFVWDKVRHNYGHYNSVRHERLLVCTRGSCMPDVNKLYDSVQTIERTNRHSAKPEEFRNIIDTLYPHGRRLELFAREKHEGWDCWGDECDSPDAAGRICVCKREKALEQGAIFEITESADLAR